MLSAFNPNLPYHWMCIWISQDWLSGHTTAHQEQPLMATGLASVQFSILALGTWCQSWLQSPGPLLAE